MNARVLITRLLQLAARPFVLLWRFLKKIALAVFGRLQWSPPHWLVQVVKKLFGELLPNESNAGPELRYFDGALVVTCDKQTQRVQSICLDLSTETFRTQWRTASAKRHLYELPWDWSGESYESLPKLFGPKLGKHVTDRGETFDYKYSPRTTVSFH